MRAFIYFMTLIYFLITNNSVHYCLLIVKTHQLGTRLLVQFTFNVLEAAINQNIVGFLLTNDKSKSRPKPQPSKLLQAQFISFLAYFLKNIKYREVRKDLKVVLVLHINRKEN